MLIENPWKIMDFDDFLNGSWEIWVQTQTTPPSCVQAYPRVSMHRRTRTVPAASGPWTRRGGPTPPHI